MLCKLFHWGNVVGLGNVAFQFQKTYFNDLFSQKDHSSLSFKRALCTADHSPNK